MPLHTFRSRKLPSTCTDVYLRLPLLVHQCILCILAARAVVPSVNLPRHYCLYCKSCCNFVKISTLLVCPLARREALSLRLPGSPSPDWGLGGLCVGHCSRFVGGFCHYYHTSWTPLSASRRSLLPDSWCICISNGEWRRGPGKLVDCWFGGFGFTCPSPALTARSTQLSLTGAHCSLIPSPFVCHVWHHAC